MSVRVQETGKQVERKVKTAASQAPISPLMENLLRLAYIVRGSIYVIIGTLAFQVVLGGNGKLTDPQGAIATVGSSPVGKILQFVILIGLIAYGLWGFVRAIFDPLHKGSDAKGNIARIGFLVSGISYLFLGYATYNIIQGRSSAAQGGSSTAQLQSTIGTMLSQPWGVWVVGIVAVVVIVVGVLKIKEGFDRNFPKQFSPYTLSEVNRKLLTRLGRFGEVSRGIIYAMIGFFLLLAAMTRNPGNAQGFDGVFYSILKQPYGIWLLGFIALGLIAFGVYSIMSGALLRLKRDVLNA
jgi:hypothetical protein